MSDHEPLLSVTTKSERVKHPCEVIADRVGLMSALGYTHEQIAGVLGMSRPTMVKHYRENIQWGRDRLHEAVGGKIYKAALAGEPWALSLVAARRMGWKETSVNVNAELERLAAAEDVDAILHDATPEELEVIERVLSRRSNSSAEPEADGGEDQEA